MILVTVELWPYGYEKDKKLLGQLKIGNVGYNPIEHTADYRCWMTESKPDDSFEKMEGKIWNHKRDQLGIWNLVLKALRICGIEQREKAMSNMYNFPVYGTQGGGLVRSIPGSQHMVFVEAPDPATGLKIGDLMPEEWGAEPANDLARTEVATEDFSGRIYPSPL